MTVASTVAKPPQTKRVPYGQLWNVCPAHRPRQTVLGDVTTDELDGRRIQPETLAVPAACPMGEGQ